MNQKIALFHPWIKSRGGGERVVLDLLEKSKHDIDIYTWVYDKENTFPEFKNHKINIIAPKITKKLSRFYLLRGLFLPLCLLQKLPLQNYNKFLISTSGIAEFIIFRNRIKGNTYAYVHTPLRDANKKIVKWNLENKYKNNLIKKEIYLMSVKIYKIFEKLAWKRLDYIIFNSELSKSRAIQSKILKTNKTKVVHPPVDLDRFQNLKNKKKDSKTFVYISRINPPKRQHVLIKAWEEVSERFPEYKLIIAGTPDNKKYYEKIKQMSKGKKSIILKPNISDKELEYILSKAKAGIFLGYQEDFGIAPIEVISSKTPLFAVNEGGYVELVKDNPLFYGINERHNDEEMVQEIIFKLTVFICMHPKSRCARVKLKDFVKEIDSTLS